MKKYKSRSGKSSGVKGYMQGRDYIVVQFVTGEVYKYTYASAGEETVEAMKTLANAQEGLSTYVAQHQPGYE